MEYGSQRRFRQWRLILSGDEESYEIKDANCRTIMVALQNWENAMTKMVGVMGNGMKERDKALVQKVSHLQDNVKEISFILKNMKAASDPYMLSNDQFPSPVQLFTY